MMTGPLLSWQNTWVRLEIYNQFIKRSENWRNNFDKTTGFMRPRLADGSFKRFRFTEYPWTRFY